MSNLGWYQIMTTVSKKVGGPLNLVKILFGGGAVAGGGIAVGTITIKNKVTKKLNEKKRKSEAAIVYTVKTDQKSNEGLSFKVGEQFKVLEVDGDAALIVKLGDNNNPYFVSAKFLRSISDY